MPGPSDPDPGTSRQSQSFQGFQGFLLPFGLGHAPVEHGQLHVFEGRSPGKQIEPLEDETDLLVADRRQFIPVQPAGLYPPETVLPPCRLIQATDDVHERRFTEPYGPMKATNTTVQSWRKRIQGMHGASPTSYIL